VAAEPEFALGDSNGISPTILHTMIMVDTTCTKARKVHYARSNFKFDFRGGTNIITDSEPLLDYKAPGAFGETGDNRQYTFLMYIQPGRKRIDNLELPAEGEAFDITKFESDNGLKTPVAGVGMVVKLGGEANCEGGDANTLPTGLPSASAAPTSAAASAAPTSAAASAAPTSAATSGSATPSGSTVVSSSAAAASSVASTTSARSSGASGAAGAVPSSGGSQQAGTATSGPATAVPTVATSLAPASTALVTSVQSGGPVGSPSVSSAPAEQTTNAAPDLSFAQGMLMAPFVAMVGALVL
jgi:hypothetical protein